MNIKTMMFPIGSEVTATPLDGDFASEFTGTVIGYKDNYIQVQDQDDNVFDCELSQLNNMD